MVPADAGLPFGDELALAARLTLACGREVDVARLRSEAPASRDARARFGAAIARCLGEAPTG
jgi:hypothetical protein